jgi:nucleotide-binding universal stress UspA family protein
MARLRAMAKIGARVAAEGWLFKHILIPTDGSDLSRKAVLYGVQLAKASGARMTGLTIAEPYRVASMDAVLVSIGEDEYDGESRRISERALEQVKKWRPRPPASRAKPSARFTTSPIAPSSIQRTRSAAT